MLKTVDCDYRSAALMFSKHRNPFKRSVANSGSMIRDMTLSITHLVLLRSWCFSLSTTFLALCLLLLLGVLCSLSSLGTVVLGTWCEDWLLLLWLDDGDGVWQALAASLLARRVAWR